VPFDWLIEGLIKKVFPPLMYAANASVNSFELANLRSDRDPDQWKDPENNPNGVDCNGKEGPGNFCYCESQGFTCACEYEEMTETKLTCHDHTGFNCSGEVVDGEFLWCMSDRNFYRTLNQRWSENRRLQLE